MCKRNRIIVLYFFCISAFDLKKISIIDSIVFKGHHIALKRSYVTAFMVFYSIDNMAWLPIEERYGIRRRKRVQFFLALVRVDHYSNIR